MLKSAPLDLPRQDMVLARRRRPTSRIATVNSGDCRDCWPQVPDGAGASKVAPCALAGAALWIALASRLRVFLIRNLCRIVWLEDIDGAGKRWLAGTDLKRFWIQPLG
jgi:hypothetical protein